MSTNTPTVPVNQPDPANQEIGVSGEVRRDVRPASPRYRNEMGKFSIHRDSRCVACGKCVAVCPDDTIVNFRQERKRYVKN